LSAFLPLDLGKRHPVLEILHAALRDRPHRNAVFYGDLYQQLQERVILKLPDYFFMASSEKSALR
jgi:hypothetical protein